MNRPLALLSLLLAFAPPAASAQPPPAKATTVTLRPASEPRPPLKYRLVPPRPTLEAGNAAVFYHRALMMLIERRNRLAGEEERRASGKPAARGVSTDEKISNWTYRPLAEIPRDEARAALGQFADSLREVDFGVKRLDCDWGFDHRTEGASLLIPEIQEIRSIARLLSLQARLAILDGDLDRAFDRVETGLTMARHVARGPLVIQALVGVAISNEMVACLQALVQAPGAPSLYWALANRPRPFIDMTDAFEAELDVLADELPALRDLEPGVWGQDQARRFVDELQGKLVNVMPGPLMIGGNSLPNQIPANLRRLDIAAACAKAYPEARRALIADGRAEAEVDAMPVVQVAALHTYREYRQAIDDMHKGTHLPYWQSAALPKVAGLDDADARKANPLWATFGSLVAAIDPARLAGLRLDRQLDALQCVEAIRLDATSQGGKLPGSLEAITSFPCPLDPATGKPFAYEAAGDSATLNGPIPAGAPDHPSYAIRYALQSAR